MVIARVPEEVLDLYWVPSPEWLQNLVLIEAGLRLNGRDACRGGF